MNQEVVFVNDADAANGDSSSSDEQVFVDSGPDADDVSEGAGPESRGSGAAAERTMQVTTIPPSGCGQRATRKASSESTTR